MPHTFLKIHGLKRWLTLLCVTSSLLACSVAQQDEIQANASVLTVTTPVTSCANLTFLNLETIGGPGSKVNSATEEEHNGVPVCTVEGTLAPAINFKTLLPQTTWTQRYLQTGCGGLCGSLNIRIGAADGCAPVDNGEFVLASTDMGHKGHGGEFGADPQKRIDFAYRGVHLTALASKALIQAYYGQQPKYSYFTGCSDGGREALMAAQRYPEDFDGIVAGAPAMNFSVQNSFFHAWQAKSNTDSNGHTILHAQRLPILHNAVLAACDTLDGQEDGLLTDPRACNFDPMTIVCEDHQAGDTCLSNAEATVAQKFYQGPKDPQTGTALALGGPQYGSELSWPGVYVPRPGKDQLFSKMIVMGAIPYLIYQQNPPQPYDLNSFKFNLASFEEIKPLYGLYSSTNTDLTAFKARGGKLMLWHGWSDQHISPINTIAYYEGVKKFMGEQTEEFIQLYLLPGMYHCAGGEGPNQFDMLSKVMAWVEQGTTPNEVVAHQGSNDQGPAAGTPDDGGSMAKSAGSITRSRPVYPYPLIAQYTGQGDANSSENYQPVQGNKGPKRYRWAGEEFMQPGYMLDCDAIDNTLACQ
ncbi:tannase/feruloyl esterase family alpha/beta hydrolase [Halioxenophilus aromaticivorans]|uniref:Tannase/feruloyl esterase family alpha/beta hydrolase n=1 Tax=Halioxenophilus aromaticivorans TaxID=1306992 RepID=A0AAV3UA51_9ALTE